MKRHADKRRSSGHVYLWAAALFLAPVLMCVPLSTMAAGANNVRLYGALVAEPCLIAPGEESIALDFGTVVDKYLYQNTRTRGQPFSIHLVECDVSLGKTVKARFSGTENTALPGLLAVDGGRLKGIAIGLETPEGKLLVLNTQSDAYALQAGGNEIALKAYVRGEPEAIKKQSIERGSFSAVATFSLEYE